MPLRWDELTEDVTPRYFGMREALQRSKSTAICSRPCSRAAKHPDVLKKLR